MNFNQSYFPIKDDYKHTIIYTPITDTMMIHPIYQNWGDAIAEQWGFDGVNGSAYLVRPSGINDFEGNEDSADLFAYFYDYSSETYIDKSLVIKTFNKTTNSHRVCTIVGNLVDNTAIFIIKDGPELYIFRY